ENAPPHKEEKPLHQQKKNFPDNSEEKSDKSGELRDDKKEESLEKKEEKLYAKANLESKKEEYLDEKKHDPSVKQEKLAESKDNKEEFPQNEQKQALKEMTDLEKEIGPELGAHLLLKVKNGKMLLPPAVRQSYGIQGELDAKELKSGTFVSHLKNNEF